MSELEKPVTTHQEVHVRIRDKTSLSNRPREILDLSARGLSRKEIAEKLSISPNTVKSHAENAFNFLGANNELPRSKLTGYQRLSFNWSL